MPRDWDPVACCIGAFSCFYGCYPYVTHDFKEALTLADTLYVMNEGHLELFGTPYEVYESGNAVVEAFKEGSGLK